MVNQLFGVLEYLTDKVSYFYSEFAFAYFKTLSQVAKSYDNRDQTGADEELLLVDITFA